MHVVLDIDDTITHAPQFFSALTHGLLNARVTVITYREDRDESVAVLEALGIRYDDLITSKDERFPSESGEPLEAWKARVVMELRADVFFEDMPEVIHRIEPPTKVFMTCDDVMREWVRDALGAG
jgi:hypothetical protein